MADMKATWRTCPRCGKDWPHASYPSPTSDRLVNWTCAICLHAEIATLTRELHAHRGETDE